MNENELRSVVLKALATVAPEVEEAALDDKVAIRDQIDIDSMDHLNFMIALHEALGVEIPESDYAQIVSVGDCVGYLAPRLEGRR